jgi:hypothetical protein
VRTFGLFAFFCILPQLVQAQNNAGIDASVLKGRPCSPYANRAFPTDVYFRDTRVHTALSADARGEQALKAIHYARVIAMPMPRWTAYDKVRSKHDLPANIPLKVQERAHTAPIWNTSNGPNEVSQ